MTKLCKRFAISLACLFLPLFLVHCTQNNQPKPNQSGYVKVDHGRLFYQIFGQGDPIVILHGGPGLDQTYLQPQMLELAKDHQVIFYDQRGSGQSLQTAMIPRYVNLEQFTNDINDLRTELKLKKITLIGHSWGGLLALNYAHQYPKTVSHLILLNSAPADDKGNNAFLDEFNKRTAGIKNKIKPFFNYNDFEKLSVDQITQIYKDIFTVYFYNQKNIDQLTLNFNKDSALSGFKVMNMIGSPIKDGKFLKSLHTLKVPTLIIHGEQDVISVNSARKIQTTIPNAQGIYLAECGHFSYIEKPDEVFKAIRAFLGKPH